MASVNKVILLGNLGADPETRYSPDGSAITNVRLATTDTWKDKATGERREATEWHRVVFFGRLAEIASEYLRKGSPVYIEGRIRTRKWTDKDGNERYTTEITADAMQLLGGRGGQGGSGGGGGSSSYGGSADGGFEEGSGYGNSRPQRAAPPPAAPKKPAGGFDDMDDDIPF